MASDALSLLLWSHVTLCIAILVVLALRVPLRRLAGARVAYTMWLVPPIASLAWLLPARQVAAMWSYAPEIDAPLQAIAGSWSLSLEPISMPLVAVWAAGLAGALAIFVRRQRDYVVSVGSLRPAPAFGDGAVWGSSATGPAVVGALRPVIVLPYDFCERYSPSEQAMIIEHERMHLRRHDPLVNAAVLAVRAVNWFNPMVHLAARALRADQEMACDAAVLARNGAARRTYAEAILKSHAPAVCVPAGCAWRSPAFYSLKERILMLGNVSPSRLRRGAGLSFVVASALIAGGAVWLARPAKVIAAPVTLSGESKGAIALAQHDARRSAACKRALAEQWSWNFWREDYGTLSLRTLICVGLPRHKDKAGRQAGPA